MILIQWLQIRLLYGLHIEYCYAFSLKTNQVGMSTCSSIERFYRKWLMYGPNVKILKRLSTHRYEMYGISIYCRELSPPTLRIIKIKNHH